MRTPIVMLVSILAWAAASAPSFADPLTVGPSRTIYLIRHGEYDHDDERDPDVGRALVPLGREQARLVGERLRDLPVELTSLHASTMTRARQTAEIVAGCLPDLELQLTRDLRECLPPTRRADVAAGYDPAEPPACAEQLARAWERCFTPPDGRDEHDVLVCHGNVIRWFVCRTLEVDPEAWLGMNIGNCSLTVIRVYGNDLRKLVSFGDVGHIPPALQTYP